MVFSSLIFTFAFLPLVIILYYLVKEKYRNYVLLAASLIFYAYGEPKFVYVMMASIAINYLLAFWISKKRSKAILILDIALNIALLFVFKYLNFTVYVSNSVLGTNIVMETIALPIGISFFTFQAMSYVIDVYRGTVQVQKNPLYVALYISFFPQLVAGPIVRYSTIEEQISHRTCSVELFGEGVQRFLLGFGKKVILANNLYAIVNEIFTQDITTVNPVILWIGSICYSLQIFFDFCGYSDMAIGLGRMFGFTFEENFDYPYISKSATEFWRRWHMSLGQWFRDYVYIPLGGSRVSVPRHIFNMFVVWALTGIWHGANYTFIAWGLEFFVLLVLEKYIVKPDERGPILSLIWRIVTLMCINLGWLLFNSVGVGEAAKTIIAMFGYYKVPVTFDSSIIRLAREYGFFIVAGIAFSTPVAKVLGEKIYRTQIGKKVQYLVPFGYLLVFLWSVSYLILGGHNPFIYFNF